MKKQFKYNVNYSLFINNNEYPKTESFTAINAAKAESECMKLLRIFSDPSGTFKIHSVELASSTPNTLLTRI
jgi:hypothetical protein